MTLTQLLKREKLKLTGTQKSRIGSMIKHLAVEKGVKMIKVDETIQVLDYPDDFIPSMEEQILKYLSPHIMTE